MIEKFANAVWHFKKYLVRVWVFDHTEFKLCPSKSEPLYKKPMETVPSYAENPSPAEQPTIELQVPCDR